MAGDPRGAGEICAAALRLAARTSGRADLRGLLEEYQQGTDPVAAGSALLAALEGRVDTPLPAPDKSADPVRTMHRRFDMAISIGAPVYNAGDHQGCYEVYAAVARTALAGSSVPKHLRARLEGALADCEVSDDPNKRAWAMRRGLDAVLGMGPEAPPAVKTIASPSVDLASLVKATATTPSTTTPSTTTSSGAIAVVHYPDGDLYPNAVPPIWKPKDGPPVAIGRVPSHRRAPRS